MYEEANRHADPIPGEEWHLPSKHREGGSSSDDRERVHALVARTSSSPSFIIDSGASRHMVSTKEEFSSLDMSKGPPIVLGDDSLTESLGKGRIDIDAGPFPHMSMSQVKYALNFIDDFSRYCWVYFLKHKSEVFGLFKVFKALVENQTGRKLKVQI